MRYSLHCAIACLAIAATGTCVAMPRTRAAGPRTLRQTEKRDWRVLLKEIDNYIMVVQPLALGCERPGVRVDLVFKGIIGCPIEHWEHLRLTDGSRSILIAGLNDLRGRVVIRDGRTALHYVRLLTSPETWFLWHRGQIEVEIVDPTEIKDVPNFGLKREMPLREWGDHGNGDMGVIDAKVFTARGFSHPVLRTTSDGFDVERWLYVEVDYRHCRIEHVREHVRRDGAAVRTVLTATPPQSGRECGFEIPMLE